MKTLFTEPLDLEDDLPGAFYSFEEDKLILKFQGLKMVTDRYPEFTIHDCLRGNLKVGRSKSPTKLFKSVSSPENQEIVNIVEKPRSRSEPLSPGEVLQALPTSKNKTRGGFFKRFTVNNPLFNKRPGRPRSDSELLAKPGIEESQFFPPLSEINKDSKEVSQLNDKKEPKLKRTTKYKSFTPFVRPRGSVANVLSNSDKENFEENTPPLSEKQQKAAETTKIEKGQDDSDSEEDKSETGCPTLP